MTVTKEMIGAAHDVMLKKGDFVLSAALVERIYLAMGHVDKERDSLRAELAAAKKERDELLEALETLAEHFEYYMGDNECRPMENARAAIARAKGQ